MFTGLVEEMGTVSSVEHLQDSVRLGIQCQRVLEDAQLGDSISVSGVCLTVAELQSESFFADVMKESLDRTNLGQLTQGSPVNLERALPAGGRLGGHVMQGHVDAVAELLSRSPGERWDVLRFSLPSQIARYVVLKGSIAVSGTSLTVSNVGEDFFEVSLIPVTLAETILGQLTPGAQVNLEVDVLAKYVEKLLGDRVGGSGGVEV